MRHKLIIVSQKKYRLQKEFKELVFRLESNKEFKLSRTDRILIALAAQTGAHIDTTNAGITDAVTKLKISKNPWRKYFLNIEK